MEKNIYYLINFKFICGEYENNIQRVITSNSQNETNVAHEFLLNYTEDVAFNPFNDNYELNDGDAVLVLNEIQEISKEEYIILSKYLV